jgi:hypothetical protein
MGASAAAGAAAGAGAGGAVPIPGAKVPTAAEIAAAKESYRYCACDDVTALVCGGIKQDGKTAERGQTFPNECIAKCAGAAWVTNGACPDIPV